MTNYYLVYFGESGVTFEPLSKETLLKELNEGDKGIEISAEMSKNLNSGKEINWPDRCDVYRHIIIKGEVIIPKEVETVTEYKID